MGRDAVKRLEFVGDNYYGDWKRVRNASRGIVISDGRIVDSGKHDELMKRCDLYREMAKLQEYEVEP